VDERLAHIIPEFFGWRRYKTGHHGDTPEIIVGTKCSSIPFFRATQFLCFLGFRAISEISADWHALCNTGETVAKTKPDLKDTVRFVGDDS